MPAFNNTVGPTGAVTELFEVWLIDTGKFVVLRDVLPEYRQDRRWMRQMRLRRALRMFLPETEIGTLPAVETVFSVANRGFEIRDTVKRWESNGNMEPGAVLNTLRTVVNHATLFPAEAQLPVRSTPRKLPPICWITPEEEERRKRVAAGLEPDTPKTEAKPKKPKKGKP